MKNIIIGTAGHIDHGKTTLIKALTGRNTDRWEEEQRRGITIDLGFTYFDLPGGDRAGIIDVPGHEKFINNMVAGVVGMDLVLLVIAADEGIMPQTREHMDILNLLGIEKSIIVLNKCDLVDEEWLEMMEEDVREELSGTFLEHAPLIRVSAVTGEGLGDLVKEIEHQTRDEVVQKDIHTIPRLPIDRVFSLSGFGTIITGTLVSGTITKEDTLQMYPVGTECKIRSIQVHGEDKKECYAGQRVAINLSNVKKKEIKRGCVLAPLNSMKNTDLLDVKLNVLDSSVRILTNHTRLHFFTGTSEVLCRAVLLDKEEIGPGESGYVQLRMEEEVAVRRGDKFVVRFYSPMETIGGGVILEPNPKIKRRFQPEVIEELKRKEEGSSADVIICILKICNVGNAEFKCHITCGCHLNTVSKQSKTCNIRTCGNIILLYNLLACLIQGCHNRLCLADCRWRCHLCFDRSIHDTTSDLFCKNQYIARSAAIILKDLIRVNKSGYAETVFGLIILY
jgi:selenocysteine-specific elongation factor SelB